MTYATGGRLTATGVRYFVAITGAIALACYVGLYTRPDAGLPIHSDGYSYYVYLPIANTTWSQYRELFLQFP